MANNWIGVDLDGTLAFYDGWHGSDYIGIPIMPMVDRVKRWIREGKKVKIFTARAASNNTDKKKAVDAIKKWCVKNIGQELEVTAEKDRYMSESWDDRCKCVKTNTGKEV